MKHLVNWTLGLMLYLCTGAVFAQNAQRDPAWNYPPQLPGSRTEVYKTIGDTQLKVWIYEPNRDKFTGKRPAIVFFFGGGWRGGSPGQFAKHCEYLRSRGMVAMTADYRVAGRHKTKADSCVADCKSAVRWIRTNADRLGVDPNRIAAGGGSAGGHTAACTAVINGLDDPADDTSISSVPNALALFNPAVMLENYKDDPRWDELAERRYKKEPLSTRTGVPPREISPVHHIRSGLPPTIIFHGEADTTVPFWTVEVYTKAVKEAGNRCELRGFPGQAHGFFNTGRGGNAEKQHAERRMFAKTIFQLDEFLNTLGYVDGPPAPIGDDVR
jgi:acetyl esterase